MIPMSGAGAPTAAEIDWVPRESLTAARRDELLWFCEGAYVAPEHDRPGDPDTVTALADETRQKLGEFIDLRGNVRIESGTRTVTSPRIRYDERSRIARIDGPLVLRDAGLAVTGASAHANLFDGTGTIEDSSLLLHDFGLRGRSAQLERFGNADITLTRARFTRCEPGDDSWSLRARRVRLEMDEGVGTARDVTIRVRDVPVLYTPYLRFPIDDRRQSGFLLPTAGYDSESGTEIVIPYYFNIAPAVDATWQLQSQWRRGLLHDGQLRFLLGPTANEINLGYLDDDDLYDPRRVIDDSTGAGTGFTPEDRWYLNVRHESDDGGPWKSTLDYNAVSDGDYLTDLDARIGSSAIENHGASVGNSIVDRRTPALDRLGRLVYFGERWRHTLTVQGFQVLDPEGPEQYEKLPEWQSRYRGDLGPLAAALDLEFARFDKNNDGITGIAGITGNRYVADASLSLRRSTMWGYIEPAFGVIHRHYDLDDVPAGPAANPSSTIPRLSLDAGLVFDRFFSFRDEPWQQTLEPRAFLLYVDAGAQDELPRFDANPASASYATLFRVDRCPGRDRIGDARRIGVGVTSRLLARDTGAERLSVSIGRSYHFGDRVVQFRPQPGDDPTRDFSPVFTRARLNLDSGLDITGTYEWEPDAGRSNRGTLSVEYRGADHRRLFNLRYVFASPLVERIAEFRSEEESDVSFIWPLAAAGDNVSVIGRWNFSWDRNQTVESFAGIEFNNCCLKTRLVVRRFLQAPREITVVTTDPGGGTRAETRTITPEDKGIFVEFQLKGLTTLGRRLDILLDRGIPGYRQREDLIGR